MRDDQIEQEKGAGFATPFSAKAEEDAKRFKVAGVPVAKPAIVVPEPEPAAPAAPAEPAATAAPAEPAAPAAPAVVAEKPVVVPKKSARRKAAAPAPVAAEPVDVIPDVAEAAEKPTTEPVAAEAAPGRTALQMALDTDDELDAKSAVAQIGKMAGIEACALMFADGLSLAGSLPEEYAAEGLCAMAPSILQRVEGHMIETKLGELRGMTLSCAKGAVTFFMRGNLCLAALHTKEELASDVRERLARAVTELSIQYSNPA
jgi:predicted regulator of Ras-like GTPase activity (Roadblock/LC7/MglB family)